MLHMTTTAKQILLSNDVESAVNEHGYNHMQTTSTFPPATLAAPVLLQAQAHY